MKTHGMRDTPTYRSWAEMLQRCSNPNKWQHKHYGGRGIRVCVEWAHFENFLADMGERPNGTTLDRIENDDHYRPGNCRWATKLEQANNARSNRKLSVNGETIGLCEASRKYGVDSRTIWRRLELGWSETDAAMKPVRAHKPYERAQRV